MEVAANRPHRANIWPCNFQQWKNSWSRSGAIDCSSTLIECETMCRAYSPRPGYQHQLWAVLN